jgi:hypothetical protein
MDINNLNDKELDELINSLKVEKDRRKTDKIKEQLKQLDSKIIKCHTECIKLSLNIMYYKNTLKEYQDDLNMYKNEYLKIRGVDDNHNFNTCIQCRKYKFTTIIKNYDSHTFCKECCIKRAYCFECGNDNFYNCKCK